MFIDRLSGGSREERVALAEMLDYMRGGDTVRVASMDRLARSVVDLANIVQQCTATARHLLAQKVPKAQIARDLDVSRSAHYALNGTGAYANRSVPREPLAGV